jgi:hypothetical protein
LEVEVACCATQPIIMDRNPTPHWQNLKSKLTVLFSFFNISNKIIYWAFHLHGTTCTYGISLWRSIFFSLKSYRKYKSENGHTRTSENIGGGIRCLGGVSIPCWQVTPAMSTVSNAKSVFPN